VVAATVVAGRVVAATVVAGRVVAGRLVTFFLTALAISANAPSRGWGGKVAVCVVAACVVPFSPDTLIPIITTCVNLARIVGGPPSVACSFNCNAKVVGASSTRKMSAPVSACAPVPFPTSAISEPLTHALVVTSLQAHCVHAVYACCAEIAVVIMYVPGERRMPVMPFVVTIDMYAESLFALRTTEFHETVVSVWLSDIVAE
jgi:hypothetical protein